jgi:arabinose operon protein AraL
MQRNIEGFVFDLDGTIYLGENALPGTPETIAKLRQRGKKVLFVSNKPLYPGQVYAEKLTRLGIPTKAEDVITSGFVLGHHLSRHEPSLRYYVIGEPNLVEELRRHGLEVINEQFAEADPQEVIDPRGVDAVIVAFDRTLDYRKINVAYQALIQGARFFATNGDKTCPMPGGGIPDAGATIAALEAISGRKLELLAGKPSRLVMQVAMDRMGLPPERCIMVGDRLETDILMGQQAGMFTGAVMTGASTRVDVSQMKNPPTYIFETLSEILQVIT